MTDLWLDLRQALRLCRRAPVMAAVIVGSLTLGIGANTAVFSFVNAIQFRPLPVADENTLVDVSEWSATELCAGCGVGTSYPGFLEWRERAQSFSAMGAYREASFAVSGGGEPERAGGALVSAELFPMLGAHPVIGRLFAHEDETATAPPVALISDVLWRNRFGSRGDVIGETLKIDGRAHTIVGVMPAGFRWPEFAQLWLPLGATAANWPRTDRSLTVVARLAAGTDLQRAGVEMRTLAAAQAAANPATNARWTAQVTSLRADMTGETAVASLVFLSAVAFVLLIACANVANLLLVRALERRREIAVRLALGASRGRILRLVLTESLMFAAAGGVLGMALAAAGSRWLVAAFQTDVPYWIQFGIDWHVPLFCVLITTAAALLCGVGPALQASRRDVQSTLQEGSTASAIPSGGLRSALVVLQLTLALVLLAGAGLMIKTVARIYVFDAGLRHVPGRRRRSQPDVCALRHAGRAAQLYGGRARVVVPDTVGAGGVCPHGLLCGLRRRSAPRHRRGGRRGCARLVARLLPRGHAWILRHARGPGASGSGFHRLRLRCRRCQSRDGRTALARAQPARFENPLRP